MERAARLVRSYKYSRAMIADDEIVRGLWPAAVGKTIAKHTLGFKVVRERLVVEVEDAVWQKQLFGLSRQIVERVQKLMGSTAISAVEFRVAIPKREPQRAEALRSLPERPSLFVDEADRIADPVLKKVYRLSRKRATA